VLAFLINFYCPKACHRPDHSIRRVEYGWNYYYNYYTIPKRNLSNDTRTQDCFRVCDPSSCNLLAETNNFVLCAALISCLISQLQKPSSPELEPRTIFQGCGCSCNFLVETNDLALATFFCLAQFPRYRNHPHRFSNPIYVFGVLNFPKSLTGFKE
jgi:hypothetical protein